jgi:formate-dependent nitrite reductase membrane component NrfD
MFRILLVLISTLAPLFLAKTVNGSIEASKTLTVNALDKISARIFRQMTWTLIGISFLSTGVILSALEAAEMWGIAFTPTLGVKMGLALLGAGCLFMGLRRPEQPVVEEHKAHSAHGGIDWQELLAIVLTKWRSAGETSRAQAQSTAQGRGPEDLSPSDLDRIISALRNPEGYRSRSQPQGPDLTAH